MRAVAVLMVMVSSAFADRPPSGTYEMERKEEMEILHFKPGDKQGRVVKPCSPRDPVPAQLTIQYWAPDAVIVNSLAWDAFAYTTAGPYGPIEGHPSRAARHPSPPPRTEIVVTFRADGDAASGWFTVSHYNQAETEVECVTAYSFRGTFTPTPTPTPAPTPTP